MILSEIMPVKNDLKWNCFENSVISVCIALKRQYEYALTESWGFNYSDDAEGSSVESRIIRWNNKFYSLVETYTGVKLMKSRDDLSVYKFLDTLNDQLLDNKPVLLCMDYFLFIIEEVSQINVQLKTLLLTRVTNLFGSKVSMFDQIRCFAEFTSKHYDVDNELKKKIPRLWQSPTFHRLEEIVRNRMKFAYAVSCLANTEGINRWREIAADLEIVSSLWNTIKVMFVKCAYLNDSKSTLGKISLKIHEVASQEEEVAKRMIGLINENDKKESDKICASENYFDEGVINEYAPLSLEHLFNNKGFGNMTTFSADFSGTQEFFLDQGLPNTNEWFIDQIPFIFPETNQVLYDNISCCGQKIDITEQYCKDIFILACNEWGSSQKQLIVQFMDGKEVNLTFEISDWAATNPLYSEKIAWTGRAIDRKNGEANLMPVPVHIYAQTIRVLKKQKLNKIVLPDSPNTHIFSITLEESRVEV
jgi:hypothetical protein